SSVSPEWSRYSVTTFEPGARDVLTQGLGLRPRALALRASNPAAIMTDGLDVLVQEVMAAMTTLPWVSSYVVPFWTETRVSRLAESATSVSRATPQALRASERAILSWGRLGPASDGTTVPRSRLSVSVKRGAAWPLTRKRPWALQYFSTNSTWASVRPVKRR